MQDGYYLSTYVHISDIANLYQFHIRHDQNFSLWEKRGNRITLVHVWEMERLTGLKKHNRSFFSADHARDVINGQLGRYGLSMDDMVEIFGTPGLCSCENYHSLDELPEVSYHSVAHLFSGICSDSEKFFHGNIIALAVDGGPDSCVDKALMKRKFYSGAVVSNGSINIYPVASPGFLWTYLRKMTGLEEGSLMALATASTSTYVGEKWDTVSIWGIRDLQKAYGFVRDMYQKIISLTEDDCEIKDWDTRFTDKENRFSMMAKIVQEMSVSIMENNIEMLKQKAPFSTEDAYLSISGGYALNCPTNSFLMKKYRFKGFLSVPCVSDTGISVGMGIYYFYRNMDEFHFKFQTPFLGNEFCFVKNNFTKYERYFSDICEYDCETAAADLIRAPVVWYDSRAEIGPRALGHRSILGNPGKKETLEQLNEIKCRQWWRPVAPIVLEDKLSEWFDDAYVSPFMLHTFQVKNVKQSLVPAIVHMDGSARVQTIGEGERLYRLIETFYERTGIPMICNTSLNDKGEPVIDTIEECLNFALRKGIEIVYINGMRVRLRDHERFDEKIPCRRRVVVDFEEQESELLKKLVNPLEVNREMLIYLFIQPGLMQKIHLEKREDVDFLERFSRLAHQKLGNIPIPGI